jgi:hypothetical protein
MDIIMQGEHRSVSLSKQVLGRAAIVAIIIGSILTLLNQPDAIFGTAKIHWLALTLVYLTPFIVVSASQVFGIRAAREFATRITVFSESFVETLFSHGIPTRAIAMGLAAGSINTAITITDNLLSGRDLDTLPVALIAQALTLPAVFGVLSQTLSFRREIRLAVPSTKGPSSLRG